MRAAGETEKPGERNAMDTELRTILRDFDRGSHQEQQSRADEQRRQMLGLFPRDAWESMTLTQYAMGQKDVPDSYSKWLEFRTHALGRIGGGSALKHAIYYHREDGWTYDSKAYRNEQEAWEAIRSGFVEALELAERGEITAVDEVEGLKWAPMVRMKTLFLYYPDRVMPIYSRAHLLHYLCGMGHPAAGEKGYRVGFLNQELLSALREMPGAEGLTNLELAFVLYDWADPRRVGISGPTPFELTHEHMDMLWKRFRRRIPEFKSFQDPGDALRRYELDYKRKILERFRAELGVEGLRRLLADGRAGEALDQLRKIAQANLVQYQSWRDSIGEKEEQIAPILAAFLEVADKPYQKPSDLRPIRDAIRAQGLLPSWDTMSVILWVLRPEDYFPIKIRYYRELAEELGMPLPKGRPGTVNFSRVLEFGRAFQAALEPEQPADWVDVQSFIWCVCPNAYEKPIKPIPHPPGPGPDRGSFPLNQILYGPPGTGKTFATARMAVDIIDGDSPDEESGVKQRYDDLVEQSRIAFVTFHQSYTYEDFIEGIRPVMDSPQEGGIPRYECRDGIFKRMCIAARASSTGSGIGSDLDVSTARIWKMSLGNTLDPAEHEIYERCIEQGWIAHGFGEGRDFSACRSRGDVQAILDELDSPESKSSATVGMVSAFCLDTVKDDLIVVTDGNHKFRAIGRVTGDYALRPEETYQQTRPVEWLRVFEQSQPKERLLKGKTFSQRTIYRLQNADLKLRALEEMITTEGGGEEGNYVLIIDEINRGNISRILGELITLIEADKREGRANALSVTLPYSQKELSVPANLHIIGTMNTADKSIALVDAALRRRFKFIELVPDWNVCPGLSAKMKAVLQELNRRISMRKDRDHRIGHSYFMGVKDELSFKKAFEDSVLSLLQEYFYGDWEGLRFVLGEREGGSARFLKPLADESMSQARNRWAWFRDAGDPSFNYLEALAAQYGFAGGAADDAGT